MAKQQRRQISPQDDTEQQADTVYKIVGVSEKSWEDAGRNAVETAAGSLRDLLGDAAGHPNHGRIRAGL